MSTSTTKPDDLEAVRTIVTTLAPFDAKEQERILRWVREKIGLAAEVPPAVAAYAPLPVADQRSTTGGQLTALTIRDFVAQKSPRSDNQFAATVAYYYRFEAPQAQRKEFITADDLQEACRQAGRDRLPKPLSTLNNAHSVGLLDRGERGQFTINAVGENLVAMTLPAGASSSGGQRKPKRNATRKQLKARR
jgi:hypothetical protein